jgi:IMP and pyridine-specific 5'-nucleotidase
MKTWNEATIQELLDRAEDALRESVQNLNLPATIIRKERAVGIIPALPNLRFARESLEETVLVVEKILEMSPVSKILPFCAFNGGNDVFVDIGDKSWGVLVSNFKYMGGTILERSASDWQLVSPCSYFLLLNPCTGLKSKR